MNTINKLIINSILTLSLILSSQTAIAQYSGPGPSSGFGGGNTVDFSTATGIANDINSYGNISDGLSAQANHVGGGQYTVEISSGGGDDGGGDVCQGPLMYYKKQCGGTGDPDDITNGNAHWADLTIESVTFYPTANLQNVGSLVGSVSPSDLEAGVSYTPVVTFTNLGPHQTHLEDPDNGITLFAANQGVCGEANDPGGGECGTFPIVLRFDTTGESSMVSPRVTMSGSGGAIHGVVNGVDIFTRNNRFSYVEGVTSLGPLGPESTQIPTSGTGTGGGGVIQTVTSFISNTMTSIMNVITGQTTDTNTQNSATSQTNSLMDSQLNSLIGNNTTQPADSGSDSTNTSTSIPSSASATFPPITFSTPGIFYLDATVDPSPNDYSGWFSSRGLSCTGDKSGCIAEHEDDRGLSWNRGEGNGYQMTFQVNPAAGITLDTYFFDNTDPVNPTGRSSSDRYVDINASNNIGLSWYGDDINYSTCTGNRFDFSGQTETMTGRDHTGLAAALGLSQNSFDTTVVKPTSPQDIIYEVTCLKNDNVTSVSDKITLHYLTVVPECSDGVDNSDPEDTLADAADPGCWTDPSDPSTYNPNDNNEEDTAPPECSDGVENDGDGYTDYPNDPGCYGPGDNTEIDPSPTFGTPTITVAPSIVAPNSPYEVTWDSGGNNCTLSANITQVNNSATPDAGKITDSTTSERTYFIDCGAAGRAEATVEVIPTIMES